MEKDNIKTPYQESPGDTPPLNRKSPCLTIDYALYQKYFDESDMSEEQWHSFLDTLFSILVSLFDLGIEVRSLQQVAPEECGQLEPPVGFLPAESGDLVDCIEQSKSPFNNASDRQSGLLKEGNQK